jgi:ribosomal protein S18 acetylase RimI-like enzyme
MEKDPAAARGLKDARIRRIEDLHSALELAPALEAYASQATEEFRDGALPEGTCRRFFAKNFSEAETVFVVAETATGRCDLGVCVSGPFEDPLTGSRGSMVLILFVSPNARHQGLARRLVEEVSKALQERGIRSLAARAAHNDDALISMGERWGFVRQWELMVRE